MSDIASHVGEINRCNQRGGRMLSVIDLLDAGTVDLEIASYLGAAVLAGNSFLVGALPGGAGKTTVMGALLNFVPPGTELCAATEGVPGANVSTPGARRCFICHEIGQGPYFAYLWGRDIRDFFQLPTAGHMGATNLHADDVDQAREIICDGCRVPARDFVAWPILVFLELEGSSRFEVSRRVSTIWEGPERLIYQHERDRWGQVNEPRLGEPETRRRVRELLEKLSAENRRGIEDVRQAVLGSFGPTPQADHP